MSAFTDDIAAEVTAQQAEENAAYERRCRGAMDGLDSALKAAREGLRHAVRHLGVLTDELYHVEYAEGTDGEDLAQLIDQAAALIRSAQRAAELLRLRSVTP